MERTMTEDRGTSDWESLLDFSPTQVWEHDGPHWAENLPDLALPEESLGLSEADYGLPLIDSVAAVTTALPAKMKMGVGASFVVHALLIAASLAGLYWVPPLEAGDVESVAVEIVETQSVSANAASAVESDAAESMVSSGAEPVEAVEAETIEEIAPTETAKPEELKPVEVQGMAQPVEDLAPETAELVEQAAVEPLLPAETPVPAEPVEAASVAAEVPLLAAAVVSPVPPLETVAPLEPVTPEQPVDPVETASLQPVDPNAPPVPMTRTVAQVSEPTYPKTPAKETPPKKPAPEQPRKRPAATQPTKKPVTEQMQPKKRQAMAAGNQGASEVDMQASAKSAASKGSSGGGGSAAKYPSKVRGAIVRALRYRGRPGEVVIQLTVSANGAVSSVMVTGTSGNAELDAAAVSAATRAAPYPPIPADAGKTSWTLAVPIESKGRG